MRGTQSMAVLRLRAAIHALCRYTLACLLTCTGILCGHAATLPPLVQNQEVALKDWLGHFRGMTRQQLVREIGAPVIEETTTATGEPRLHLVYHTPAGSDLSFSFFADGTVAVVAYGLIQR